VENVFFLFRSSVMHLLSVRQRVRHSPKRGRQCPLTLEALEDRTLLSTSIPLNASSWTFIGPAPNVDNEQHTTGYTENTSGRITAIAAHPTDPNTIYIAAASGGVWKTLDGGGTWMQLTDTQSTLFMGALAVAKPDPTGPDIIYAGTGEANLGPSKIGNFRDNIYYGRGILKSVDSGSSWTLLTGTGVDGSLNNFDRLTFSQIVVDPTNPDIVYAAVGYTATNGLSGNKGIWKSTNGGLTWRNTTASITISDTAAFTDLVIDPRPEAHTTLYAAVGGYAASGTAGDPANGVYKTTDGGDTWTRLKIDPNLSDPPPGETLGRIALAIAKSNPQILYAVLTRPSDNHLLALRRTANGGSSWAGVTNPGSICPSGAININYLGSAGDYHNTLAIDPTNSDIVYAGGNCGIARSTSGPGNTWFAVAPGESNGPHRDHHALVFNANNKLLDGNDGGIWRLFDPSLDDPNQQDPHLLHWTNLNGNLQITQFMGIALDPRAGSEGQDIAYGGTQDTGIQRFQDNPLDPDDSRRWRRLLRGDGGAGAVSVAQPNRLYQIARVNEEGPFFRRSNTQGNTWNSPSDSLMTGITVHDANFYLPLVLDPSDPTSNRLLLGTKQMYETLTGGDPNPSFGNVGWRAIGTFNDRIASLAVAASDANTIYAVTGDALAGAMGHVFVTFNNGTDWQPIDIPGVTDRLAAIIIDPTDKMKAYVVRDRFGGGHVFRTTNGGQNWTDISGDLPDLPTHTIVLDDRTSPNPTLYIGTDNGVYASSDLGAHWLPFQMGLPNVLVADLKLQKNWNILAAGTHGRGVWEILVQSGGGGGAGAGAGTSVASPRFRELALAVATADSLRTAIPVALAVPGGPAASAPFVTPTGEGTSPPLAAVRADQFFAVIRGEDQSSDGLALDTLEQDMLHLLPLPKFSARITDTAGTLPDPMAMW
jgi:photosystem II stability/assembly factor-like uncharacterized protein